MAQILYKDIIKNKEINEFIKKGECEFSHAWLYGAFEDTLHAGGRTGGISAGEVRTC